VNSELYRQDGKGVMRIVGGRHAWNMKCSNVGQLLTSEAIQCIYVIDSGPSHFSDIMKCADVRVDFPLAEVGDRVGRVVSRCGKSYECAQLSHKKVGKSRFHHNIKDPRVDP
jgi:hypothetical protein